MVNTSSLGPQCRECKRRRVRCDGHEPKCRRCLREGRKCPGYGNDRKWFTLTPSKDGSLEKVALEDASPSSTEMCAESTSKLVTDMDGNMPRELAEIAAMETDYQLCESLSRTYLTTRSLRRRLHQVSESVAYCNTILLPELMPYPFQKDYRTPLDVWLKSPPIIQNVLLLIMYNHRMVSTTARDSAVTEVYQSRGEILRQLAIEVQTPSMPSSMFALVVVLMVLQAEVCVQQLSHWLRLTMLS
jgi:hypothetical protein